ncbi:hypothetical protein BDQ17DRAFT_1362679 [Cyathus striatus]|nr:hypothetical protein BDQ17DRAFT_1362679 [Cyathus striatus]
MASPIDQVRITSAICSAGAIISTLYRLYIRRSRLWADDGCALISMLALIVQVMAVFLPVTGSDPKIGIARYYLMSVSFYIIVWGARLSMLFSIIRIDPNEVRRMIMFIIAFIYFLVFIGLLSEHVSLCEAHPNWKKSEIPMCNIKRQIGISQLVADTTIDLILLIAPLRLFIILHDKWLRNGLTIIFSTCIITTVVSLVHVVYIFLADGTKVVVSGLIENCVSLVVCNIPVILTACLKLREYTSGYLDAKPPSFMIFASRRTGLDTHCGGMNPGSTTPDVSANTFNIRNVSTETRSAFATVSATCDRLEV